MVQTLTAWSIPHEWNATMLQSSKSLELTFTTEQALIEDGVQYDIGHLGLRCDKGCDATV